MSNVNLNIASGSLIDQLKGKACKECRTLQIRKITCRLAIVSETLFENISIQVKTKISLRNPMVNKVNGELSRFYNIVNVNLISVRYSRLTFCSKMMLSSSFLQSQSSGDSLGENKSSSWQILLRPLRCTGR